MPRVLGLDVSANRVAWAVCNGNDMLGSERIERFDDCFGFFVDAASDMLKLAIDGHKPDAACIEINLHPNIMHKGRPAANMIRAYMRSRWVEGALLGRLFEHEPLEITKMKGGWLAVPEGNVFALQASGGAKAKEKRRTRMSAIYRIGPTAQVSEDEIDALAIAHEACIALKTGVRK